MDVLNKYHWVIGLLLLALVTIAMLGSPDTFLGKGAFIYNNLSDPKDDQAFVTVTLDFGSDVELQEFPTEIGQWQGADYETEGLRDQLGAETLLMRAYTRPGLYQPAFFLAMQSESESSFHPPEVCYPAAGWTILERAKETIEVSEGVWEGDPGIYDNADPEKSISLPARRLLVTRKAESGEAERRVVLYFYVKPTSFGAHSDEITMIRVSATAPAEGSYQATLDIEKEMIADFLPQMFEPRDEEDLIFVHLATSGILGILALIALFAIPLSLIFYPKILRSFRR